MKSLIKKMKGTASPQGPREFKDIEKDFQQVSAQAANAQYKVYVHTKELETLNERLVQINQEAGARQALDQAAQAELAKKQTPVTDKPLDLTKSGAV